jgi:antitoxin component of MazEF toxin-antitoxin module
VTGLIKLKDTLLALKYCYTESPICTSYAADFESKFDISSHYPVLCYRYLPKKMTYPRNRHNRINNPNRRHNPLQFEARTVQLNGTSLTLTIPSLYADILGIHAGDIMKITCQKDDRKLVAQKVVLDFTEDDVLRAA